MFGSQLQKLRIEKGLTPEELAARLGISRQTVYNWEKNEVYPPVETIRQLAMLFGCSTDHLLACDGEYRSLIEITDVTEEQNAHIQMIAEDYRSIADS
ncbi:MAG: helix-turn-helix transcriptional regulator [Lachnospiraceae bacterium]|nr:helix-turn-helix transcriptional regulator [Lachnospiraceae bacterium]